MPSGATALHVGFLLRADGRWNRRGEYGCLYTALSPAGAKAEFEKMLAYSGLTPDEASPRDLVSIEAEIANVLDLTDSAVRAKLSIDRAMLIGDSAKSIEFCRSVADNARRQGYNAILSYSAAAPAQINLNIYIDGRAADIKLETGPDRVALNYLDVAEGWRTALGLPSGAARAKPR